MPSPIIIIGSGLAAYHLAREIRQQDKTCPVMMVTQDAGHFYSKPQLSTALALGKTAESLLNMSAEKMAMQYDIEILTHTQVEKIDPKENKIFTRDKQSLSYRALALCLGANTHSPALEGEGAEDLLQVNDIYQYQHFREKIAGKKNITLLGGGLVGCEFANDLTQAGYQVHVIEQAKTPMATLLPEEVGCRLKDALEEQGVIWHLGQRAHHIQRQQQHYDIYLDDQSSFRTELVFSAIGLKPRIALAKEAGIHTHRGIVVDTFLRTNIPNIYAMGDCAEINGWILPYIAPIMQTSKALAQTLTKEDRPLCLPAMPIVIKTSCYPMIISRPPFSVKASWQFEEKEGCLRAYLKDDADQLWGFILTKESIKERNTLAQSLKNWL